MPIAIRIALLAWISCLPVTDFAHSEVVTWTLSNVTFQDGGTASGAFEFDAETNVVSNWRIETQGGDTGNLPDFTYDPTTSGVISSQGPDPSIRFSSNELFGPFNNSFRILRLNLSQPLTDAGGSVPLNLDSIECINCSPFRRVTGGTLESGDAPVFPFKLYFAQFADGDGLFSQITLFNLDVAMEANVTITLKNSQGGPLTVDLDGTEVEGSLDLQIPASGLVQLKTDSLGDLVAGSVTVCSDKPLSGVVLFGGIVGLAGVGSSADLDNGFTAPMEVLLDVDGTTRLVDTGIAVMNLENEAIDLTLMLFDAQGNLVSTTTDSLEGMGQLAKFLSRLSGWNPELSLTELADFRGTLMVTATGRIAATVIQSRPGQFATMPVAPK